MKLRIKNKRKLTTVILIALISIFFVIFCFSVYKIYIWHNDNQKTNQIIKKILPTKKGSGIDFAKLKLQNSDTVAWLKVSGTDIDYPVVRTSNNDYYLSHDFDKKPNQTGWVFADYRNNFDELDQNTIIYGHASFSGLMFGTLKNIYNNYQDNHTIALFTENSETKWQIFSVYHIKTTDDYLITSFANDQELGEYIDLVTKRSINNYDSKPNNKDKILTLSTCYNEVEKTVVHAKLTNN